MPGQAAPDLGDVGLTAGMRSRSGLWASLLALALVAGVGGGAWWWQREERAKDAAAEAAVAAYVAGWNAKDMTRVAFAEAGAAEDFAAAVAGLGAAPVTAKVGPVSRSGSGATARLTVSWTLPGGRPWSYAMPVTTVERNGRWVIADAVDSSRWHPQLPTGATLSVATVAPVRGDLLDRGGAALMPLSAVYPVQIDPTRATPESAAVLEAVTGEPAGSLVAKLAAAKAASSQAPIPVITYRQADFDARRAQLDALVGVIYPRTEAPLAVSRGFGQPLLGTFGAVTAEMVEKGGGRYAAGDRAGLSGLQRQYDSTLGGTPGLKVTTSTGKVLFEEKAQDGADVTTTLAPAVQAAAEKALTGTGSVPAAMVVVDVPTGEVLAAANAPANGFDRALTGHYAPGSGFKIATTHAFLTRSLTTLDAPVGCPPTITVDGKSFRNFEGGEQAESTFARDFAMSCNTAFIGLAAGLQPDDLTESAAALGVGGDWAARIGVDGAFAGSVPGTTPGTDQAAASIGQGRIEVSPLSMAVLAGSVARGAALAPTLVKAGPGEKPATPAPLDAGVVGSLRTLMRSVVTEGSGTALRDAPGGEVFGKTGTAEYGTDSPPRTRAWFVGYQGDLAFAVIVEDGRSGGSVAAPIARAFLDSYRAAPTAPAPE